MNKKRDKKKFKRQNLKYQNIEIDDIDSFIDEEVVEEKRAEKREHQKTLTSQKSGLNLKRGKVLEIWTNYLCKVNVENEDIECVLGGRLKQVNNNNRNLVAVGDFVNVDMSDSPRIEEIIERNNSLSRYTEDDFQTEITIAANIDQVVITSSIYEPDINFGLIDRYICAAEIAGITPVICVNKIDLAEDLSEIRTSCSFYEDLGYKVLYTSALKKESLEELKEILKNKQTVFSGHSGAGKSSLINQIQPGLNLRVSEVSDFTGKGTHTTTSSKLIRWDFGGYLVDTPGIKTFGLHRQDKDNLSRIFPGFSEIFMQCKFPNCTHSHEKGCAVKDAAETGQYPEQRYNSYLRILNSLQDDRK
ncbi:ribosome small subunit-dependent GTPase A [Candidatus Cloacimonadota bacterium]